LKNIRKLIQNQQTLNKFKYQNNLSADRQAKFKTVLNLEYLIFVRLWDDSAYYLEFTCLSQAGILGFRD